MMEVLARIVSVAMVSVFVQNAIFDRAFGSNVVIYASRKNSTVIGFTLGITAMTTIASIISFFVDSALLNTQFGWLFMPLIYAAIIGALYVLALFLFWKVFPKIFRRMRKYVHLAIFNCTVIGALFLNSNYGSDLPSYIGYGFGTGIGFFLACFLLNVAREKLDSDKIPRVFRGYPIMLVYIGVVSLAFYALAGYTADF